MNFLKNVISKIPFTTYSKKVDPVIHRILSIKKIRFLHLILVYRNPLDSIAEARLRRLGFKTKQALPFINGISGKLPVRQFEALVGFLEIEKIFYDGKAFLTATQKESLPHSENTSTSFAHSPATGRGVTVAFIDSGVSPIPELIRSRNKIAAFKDFIHDAHNPYDDNGHGTLCIGAAFGASLSGDFKAIACDSSLVCAKAFDSLSTGHFSDILAAMQWIIDIKERHHIRIAVLPFGTAAYSKHFDLLGLAAEKLWQAGIFVCASAGNMGPHEGTILSPGANSSILTVGACSLADTRPKAAPFSSCGPVNDKINKPELIMPGVNVKTLSTEASGTSVAASLAAAYAALLYQKKPDLKPEDVKNILKASAVSINEIKSVQGAGMISIKKLEEWLS